MIGLLVSLAVLLLAAGGVAFHILLQHSKFNRKPPAIRDAAAPGAAKEATEKTDIE